MPGVFVMLMIGRAEGQRSSLVTLVVLVLVGKVGHGIAV